MSVEHRSHPIDLNAVVEFALSCPISDAGRAELHAIHGEMEGLRQRTEAVLSQVDPEMLFPPPDSSVVDLEKLRELGGLKLRVASGSPRG
jgi:hypothetical protein